MRARSCVYACANMYARMCACVNTSASVRLCAWLCICTYEHSYERECVYRCACVNARASVCVRT